MRTGERTTIGFDRRIDIEWLDAVAGHVATGHSPADVREFLWGLLDGVVRGDTVHSARGKTLTVLTRIWVAVPPTAERVRAAAQTHLLGLLRGKVGDALGDERRLLPVFR